MFYSFCAFLCLFQFVGNIAATDNRIVGGRPAKTGEFPFQASLRRSYNDAHFCGGAIIGKKHVLTAAHCMFYKWGGILPAFVVSISAGQLELEMDSNSFYRNASKIIIHPDYNKTTMANDIAIIEVFDEFPIDKNYLINSITLRNKPMLTSSCIVSGWGVQKHGSENLSSILLAAEVNFTNFDMCKELYLKEDIELVDGMLCARHNRGESDACQGDSGGPLVCEGLLTGIVSTGLGCADVNFPGIYTDVTYFLPWIKEIVKNETTETFPNVTTQTTTNNITDYNYTTTVMYNTTIIYYNTTAMPMYNITMPLLNYTIKPPFQGNFSTSSSMGFYKTVFHYNVFILIMLSCIINLFVHRS